MPAYVKTSAPHITSSKSILATYWKLVLIALPLVFLATLVFGWHALRLITVSIAGVLLAESVAVFILRRKAAWWNGDNLYVALLFALMLPATTSSWAAGIVIFIAVLLAKELYGGLGQNFLNVAVFGRLLVYLFVYDDAYVHPAPQSGGAILRLFIDLRDALLGFLPSEILSLIGVWGSSLAEISGIVIILCGFLLISQRLLSWELPAFYLGGLWGVTLLLGGSPLEVLLLPGTLFTAFFLLCDPVTTPCSKNGLRVFAFGTALGVGFLHTRMLYFEAASLSVLAMNVLTPWLDHLLRPTPKRFFKR